tara:strand:- start:6851 stop:7423 length:573 start_codon:yes stop_codon:yes gene_type:complete
MMAMRYRDMLLALLVLALPACTLLPDGQDLPLAQVDCRQAFPQGYEVRATLRVEPSGAKFLLALGTAPERIDLALLTVQGMPVYSLSCTDGYPEASVQTSAGNEIPPLVLMNYLAIIFMDAEALPQQLQPGWALQAHTAKRFLTRHENAAEVQIRYQGTAPWFDSIELTDSLQGVSLSIVILESSRVLPE